MDLRRSGRTADFVAVAGEQDTQQHEGGEMTWPEAFSIAVVMAAFVAIMWIGTREDR